MPEDKVIKAAFLISFTGHWLLLGAPGFNLHLPQYKKQPEELTLEFQVERPALLPKIDTVGQEKKFKRIDKKPDQPRPELKPQPLLKQITAQQVPRERIEEKVDITNPDKDAMLRYQDVIKQRIEEARRYPLWAKKQGIEGITHLYFSLLPGGRSQDIKILRSSGSRILDDEAVATLKRASPFPPIPKEINNSSVDMEVAIVFYLNKN
ncbi:MAG: energy transducer TonB [Candidatus Omnitrophota bacterium]|jgi:protein TonB